MKNIRLFTFRTISNESLSSTEKLMYIFIVVELTKSIEFEYSNNELAEIFKIHKKTVSAIINVLIEKNLIKSEFTHNNSRIISLC